MRPGARTFVATLLASAVLAHLGACSGPRRTLEQQLEGGVFLRAGPELLAGRHLGPPVVAGASGPARFVEPLSRRFDLDEAREVVEFVDRYYRAPANDGYEASLDRIAADLRALGFGSTEGFSLEVIETPLPQGARGGDGGEALAWTPLSASLTLTSRDRTRRLHGFSAPEERDRVMLPIGAPSCAVEGEIARTLDELDAGEFLVTDAAPARHVLERAGACGAIAVLSSYLEPYNTDPTGGERHLDAIQFRSVADGQALGIAMISPRSRRAILEAVEADPRSRLRLEAQVRRDARPLRTLCAAISGSDRPQEAVAIVSHVQEPGACDNASGVAGLLQSVAALKRALDEGVLARPSRSLVFLWGDEFRQSSAWLDSTSLACVAGFSSDMTGQSKERTGAIALLERMPDPGALEPLEPDRHTPWGRSEVDEGSLVPNGVALVTRCALLDVAAHEEGWDTADHPYEGGSDHDVFLARGIPAALVWHFTDFAYHTSLDRLEHVDAAEMRRTGVALLAAALALADPRPEDLDRYLRSLNEEENVRVAAAEEARLPELADRWRTWCDGARQWLRIQCLRIPASELSGTETETRR